jgi:hypothetical protein
MLMGRMYGASYPVVFSTEHDDTINAAHVTRVLEALVTKEPWDDHFKLPWNDVCHAASDNLRGRVCGLGIDIDLPLLEEDPRFRFQMTWAGRDGEARPLSMEAYVNFTTVPTILHPHYLIATVGVKPPDILRVETRGNQLAGLLG